MHHHSLTMRRLVAVPGLGFFVASGALAAAQPRFEIIDLNDLNQPSASYLSSINNRGWVAGMSDFGVVDEFRGAVWVGGRAIELGLVPGDDIGACDDVNSHGVAIGESTWIEIRHLIIFHPTAVLWTESMPVEIEDLVTSGQNWELLDSIDINDAGLIIGTGRDIDLEEPRAWLFNLDDGVLDEIPTLGGFNTDPYAINENGVIVGQSWTSGGQDHAFVYEDGVMTDLGTLGGRDSRATDINDSGLIVGGAQSPTSPELAVMWRDGQLIQLGTLGGNQSNANGVNNRDQIVGFSTDEIHNAHMFFWEDGVMYDPLDYIPPGGGWGGRANAFEINDAGQIVASVYRDGVGDAPAVLTLVELDLTAPRPGDAGQVNELTVSGAAPGGTVALVYGSEVGMAPVPQCPGSPVLLSQPRLATTARADANGEAIIRRFVPDGAAGRTYRIQAIEPPMCRVSNVVTHTF